MDTPVRVAVIAALEREMEPLVSAKGWRTTEVVRAIYRSYQNAGVLVVCAGIGSEAARKAAEKVLEVQPAVIISAGLAGGLTPEMTIGRVFLPEQVVVSAKGSPVDMSLMPVIPGLTPSGTLVSASGIAGPEGKRLLAGQYKAQAVDMEAGPVAEVANAHGIPFLAVKAISDEYDFPMPDLEPFVDRDGRFMQSKFLAHISFRPGLWSVAKKMASNSSRAAQELCQVLRKLLESQVLEDAGVAPRALRGRERGL